MNPAQTAEQDATHQNYPSSGLHRLPHVVHHVVKSMYPSNYPKALFPPRTLSIRQPIASNTYL
eukprot:273229-Alexandrium_andersonii.AAC.1